MAHACLQECPNDCSHHGNCGADLKCYCDDGWGGLDCSRRCGAPLPSPAPTPGTVTPGGVQPGADDDDAPEDVLEEERSADGAADVGREEDGVRRRMQGMELPGAPPAGVGAGEAAAGGAGQAGVVECTKNTPPDCTKGRAWAVCGSACVPTCAVPAPLCAGACVPRCQCPKAAPLWDLKGGTDGQGGCITKAACPAKWVYIKFRLKTKVAVADFSSATRKTLATTLADLVEGLEPESVVILDVQVVHEAGIKSGTTATPNDSTRRRLAADATGKKVGDTEVTFQVRTKEVDSVAVEAATKSAIATGTWLAALKKARPATFKGQSFTYAAHHMPRVGLQLCSSYATSGAPPGLTRKLCVLLPAHSPGSWDLRRRHMTAPVTSKRTWATWRSGRR